MDNYFRAAMDCYRLLCDPMQYFLTSTGWVGCYVQKDKFDQRFAGARPFAPRTLELLPRPELHGRQAQRQPLGGDRQAGVHQQPADGVHAEAALLVLAAVDPAGLADPLGPPSPVGELGRVVEHHDRAADAGGPVAGRAEVAAEDLALADPVVGEETVGRLGGGPVLAGERDALPYRARHLGEQRAQPSAQPLVGEPASRDLVVDPGIRVARHRHLPEPPRCQRIRDRPRSAGYGPLPNSRHEQRMWVIERLTGCVRLCVGVAEQEVGLARTLEQVV